MNGKPIVAIVLVCAAAGVGVWDYKKMVAPPPGVTSTPGPAIPSEPPPQAPAMPGAIVAASPAASVAEVPVTTETVTAPTETAKPASGEIDFNALFQQMVQQSQKGGDEPASKGADPKDVGAPPAAPESMTKIAGDGGSDGWSKLELRGVVVGKTRALALVNGRLLRIGDELPGTSYLIAEIRDDRVIAQLPDGSGARALTLSAVASQSSSSGSTGTQPGTKSTSSGSSGNASSAPASGSSSTPTAPTSGGKS